MIFFMLKNLLSDEMYVYDSYYTYYRDFPVLILVLGILSDNNNWRPQVTTVLISNKILSFFVPHVHHTWRVELQQSD